MGGANLVDSTGEVIWSNEDHWYKIALGDGSELGLGEAWHSSDNNGRTLMKVVPSGQGMVFRYQRADGGDIGNHGGYGWPQGDKGWFRGIQVKSDYTETIKNLSFSWDPQKLCGYDNNQNYGFIAEQLPGNRVALYAYDGHGTLCGMRVKADGEVIGYESRYAMGLDVVIVRVGVGGHFKGLF